MRTLHPNKAQTQALAALDAMMDAREAEAPQYRVLRLIQNKARRRGLITHYVEHRDELMPFLSRHPAPREFETVTEAIGWFRKEMNRQRLLGFHGHWAFSNGILAACKDRLIIARYFALVEKAEAAERIMAREAA